MSSMILAVVDPPSVLHLDPASRYSCPDPSVAPFHGFDIPLMSLRDEHLHYSAHILGLGTLQSPII